MAVELTTLAFMQDRNLAEANAASAKTNLGLNNLTNDPQVRRSELGVSVATLVNGKVPLGQMDEAFQGSGDGGAMVGIRFHMSSSQTIPNGTATIIDFNSKDLDTDDAVTTGSNWKFTAPASGVYRISAYAQTVNAQWWNESSLWINYTVNGGAENGLGNTWAIPIASNRMSVDGSDIVSLNVGDYISFVIWIWRGSATDIDSGRVCIDKIGGAPSAGSGVSSSIDFGQIMALNA